MTINLDRHGYTEPSANRTILPAQAGRVTALSNLNDRYGSGKVARGLRHPPMRRHLT
jgi:hypothetical protein